MIRVLSCNLRSGRADGSALANLIVDESIDIVCAQELSRNLAKRISAQLPFGDMSHRQIHRGNGIACRRPVTTERIRMPKRDGWVATLSPEHWSGLPRAIQIVNVHISGPHLWPYFPHPVRRRAQLMALLDNRAREDNIPHAIFGDFNSSPIWPVYKQMAARYVDGAIGRDKPETNVGGTWPYLPRVGIRGLLRIDHCFLSKLVARRIRKVEMPGSDHLGLLAEICMSDD